MRKGFGKGLGRHGRQGCSGGGQGAWNSRGRCGWSTDNEGFRSRFMNAMPRMDTAEEPNAGISDASTTASLKAASFSNTAPTNVAPLSSSRKGYTVAVSTEACIGCGTCVEVCRLGAIRLEHGKAVINEALCRSCAACVRVCPFNAIQKVHEP